MMLLGWALAFFMLTWLFHIVEENKQGGAPAERLSVMFMQDKALVLRENADGHYLAEGFINRRRVTMLIDTGAGQVALPEGMAKRLGLRKRQAGRVMTAAGSSAAWATEIDMLQIGGIRFRHLSGLILPEMEQEVVLLGMNALSKLRITQSGGELVLSAPDELPPAAQ